MSQHMARSQQSIEDGRQHEEIPLNRLTSTEERAERRRLRAIFNEVSYSFVFL